MSEVSGGQSSEVIDPSFSQLGLEAKVQVALSTFPMQPLSLDVISGYIAPGKDHLDEVSQGQIYNSLQRYAVPFEQQVSLQRKELESIRAQAQNKYDHEFPLATRRRTDPNGIEYQRTVGAAKKAEEDFATNGMQQWKKDYEEGTFRPRWFVMDEIEEKAIVSKYAAASAEMKNRIVDEIESAIQTQPNTQKQKKGFFGNLLTMLKRR